MAGFGEGIYFVENTIDGHSNVYEKGTQYDFAVEVVEFPYDFKNKVEFSIDNEEVARIQTTQDGVATVQFYEPGTATIAATLIEGRYVYMDFYTFEVIESTPTEDFTLRFDMKDAYPRGREYQLGEKAYFSVWAEYQDNIQFSISDDTVAQITNTIDSIAFPGAVVEFVGEGEATITVSVERNGVIYYDNYTFWVVGEPEESNTYSLIGNNQIAIGDVENLYVIRDADNSVFNIVELLSSNPEVAYVNEYYNIVEGVSEGNAVIVAIIETEKGFEDVILELNVINQEITNEIHFANLKDGDKYAFRSNYLFDIDLGSIPENERANVEYFVDDEYIASVENFFGYAKLDIKRVGEVTLVANLRYNDHLYTTQCTFYIEQNNRIVKYHLEIQGDNNSIGIGEETKLEANLVPNKTGYYSIPVTQDVQWYCDDSEVVWVDWEGNVTGNSEGTATITAVYDFGNGIYLADEFDVEVVSNSTPDNPNTDDDFYTFIIELLRHLFRNVSISE